MTTPIQSKLTTVKKFAETIGLSPWTIRHYAYTGRVASVKLGTRLLIPVSEIDRLIEENMRPRVIDQSSRPRMVQGR
jgi:hypothetical protein